VAVTPPTGRRPVGALVIGSFLLFVLFVLFVV
jgi:hypothetical protein